MTAAVPQAADPGAGSDLSSILSSPHLLASFLYLLALIGVGVWKARRVKDSDDFMVAGRTLPWWVLVGTLLATWIGNGSLFGGAGLGYRNGLSGLWSSAGAWLGILLVFFIARRVRNLGQVTVPDILEERYGRGASTLGTITTVIAYLTIVSYQFKGGGKILEIVTEGGIDAGTGIVLTAIFAVLYTVLAGMLSVVYTDVVNGVIMTFGVLLALAWMLSATGGLGEVLDTAAAMGKGDLFGHWAAESDSGASGPVVAISFFVPTALLLLGDANVYQRIFSARNAGTARKAVAVWVVGVVLLESSISLLGLTGSVAGEQGIMPNLGEMGKDATETVIPTLALHVLPTGLGMLLVATMLAIVVSTADSFLLVPATNLTRDVYQQYLKPGATGDEIVRVSRILVLALGVVAYLLVDQFPTILSAAYTAYLIYGTSITPALLAAFLWRRATRQGAIASILTGTAVTLLWTFGLDTSGFHPILAEVTFPATTLSVLALVGVSLSTAAPSPASLDKFFNESETGAPVKSPQTMSLYALTPNDLSGAPCPLSQFEGQVTLVVNVASECGYTPQYAGLVALHEELAARGFSVLAFPSNEFGRQEPGTGEEIRAFCDSRYGVSFPMFEKCATKPGDSQSPVYALLGSATGELPAWNFAKYLVGRDGTVLGHYASGVAPDDAGLRADIEAALGSKAE